MRKVNFQATDAAAREPSEPPHHTSLTGVVVSALESGVSPIEAPVPGEDEVDPDGEPIEIAFLDGLDTPDENDVDDIGRMYGVSEPEGDLSLGEELISPRDAHRWELSLESKEAEEADADESIARYERDLETIADESDEE